MSLTVNASSLISLEVTLYHLPVSGSRFSRMYPSTGRPPFFQGFSQVRPRVDVSTSASVGFPAGSGGAKISRLFGISDKLIYRNYLLVVDPDIWKNAMCTQTSTIKLPYSFDIWHWFNFFTTRDIKPKLLSLLLGRKSRKIRKMPWEKSSTPTFHTLLLHREHLRAFTTHSHNAKLAETRYERNTLTEHVFGFHWLSCSRRSFSVLVLGWNLKHILAPFWQLFAHKFLSGVQFAHPDPRLSGDISPLNIVAYDLTVSSVLGRLPSKSDGVFGCFRIQYRTLNWARFV